MHECAAAESFRVYHLLLCKSSREMKRTQEVDLCFTSLLLLLCYF